MLTCWAAERPGGAEALPHAEVLLMAATAEDPELDVVIGLVVSHLVAVGDVGSQSTAQVFATIGRFCAYIAHLGAESLDGVGATVAGDFIKQAVQTRTGAWIEPAPSTQHTRRSAIRTLYGAARQLGLATLDPTIDIKLSSRAGHGCRPLDDEEELLCRVWARRNPVDTRHPAAWALGQATATNSELAAATVGDVDLDIGTVRLHGNELKREPRHGALTAWGVERLAERLAEIGGDPYTPLLTAATASRNATQASTNSLIHEVLVFAGLRDEPGIKPSSLPAWAGRRAYDTTGHIEVAAHALGVRSLDAAARQIGWAW